jgi:hypothetical protein
MRRGRSLRKMVRLIGELYHLEPKEALLLPAGLVAHLSITQAASGVREASMLSSRTTRWPSHKGCP